MGALMLSHNSPLSSRDIALALIQSKDNLRRDVHVRPLKGENILQEIGAPSVSILKAIKLSMD